MSAAAYKVWHCWYSWSGSYGAYQDYNCVVVAEIESKALGMALMEYPDSVAARWHAEEIPIDREGAHHISERSS